MCSVTNDDSRAAYMVGVALEDKILMRTKIIWQIARHDESSLWLKGN
jgi:hypothetical protein